MTEESNQNCIAIRQQIRDGKFTQSTAGHCLGFIQANVVILPSEYAESFAEYCYLNPKPCPLLAIGERGDPSLYAPRRSKTQPPGPSIDWRSHGLTRFECTLCLDATSWFALSPRSTSSATCALKPA